MPIRQPLNGNRAQSHVATRGLVLEAMPAVRIAHALGITGARSDGQDRARVFETDEQVVVVLADGAGGTRSGAVAAQAIVDAIEACHDSHDDWSTLLCELDLDTPRLGNGQSTAVIIAIRNGLISGVSVGDSCAWLIHDAEVIELTEGQARKPVVGGGCLPFALQPTRLDAGTLLVASDGLWRYAKRRDIAAVANGADLSAAVQALVDLVRLPTGGLQDDVAVVLCRKLVDGDRR